MDSGRKFYAVKFIQLPFKGIDKYVCVPSSWIQLRKSSNPKVLAAYPKNEDPFDIRKRVIRREKHSDDWDLYLAIIKYESDTFRAVDLWIAARTNNDSWAEEDILQVRDAQPKPATNGILHSIPVVDSSKSTNSAKPISATINQSTMEEPGCSNRNQSITIQDREFIESFQVVDTAAASNGERINEQSIQPQRIKEETPISQPGPSNICQRRKPSIPVINLDSSDDESQILKIHCNNLDQKVRQQETRTRQSEVTNLFISQTHLVSNATTAPMTAQKPLSTNVQTSQTHQNTRQSSSRSSENSTLNFQPYQTDNRFTEMIHDDQTPSTSSGITSNISSFFRNMPNSQKLSMKPKLLPIGNTVLNEIRLENITKNTVTPAQPSSSSVRETSSPSTCLTKREPSIVTQKHSQNVPVNPRNIGENHIDLSLLRGKVNRKQAPQPGNQVGRLIDQILPLQDASNSTAFHNRSNLGQQTFNASGSQATDQRVSIEDILMNEAFAAQHPTAGQPIKNIPCSRENQYPPVNQDNLQQERQRQDPHKNSTASNYTNSQPARAILSAGLAKKSNVNISVATRNIPAEPAFDVDTFEIPSCLSNQSVRNNMYQYSRVRKRLVDQSTETDENPVMERVRFEDHNIIRSSNNVIPQSVDSACQTDESITEDTMYIEIASDNEVVTEHGVVSGHDMSTNETSVETTNEANSFQLTSETDLPDRQIAPQSPTTNSLCKHPRTILNEKMLNECAIHTHITQMGSTLANAYVMYNNLRSSILESADVYQNLLDTVKKINNLGNSASTPSSNVTSDVSRATEEIQVEMTEEEISGNGSQCNNNANEPPKKKQSTRWTFVLPSEYDPNDTRWTLKYQQFEPGLVELMPNSNIFVSYGELHYCTRESRNCTELASLLLEEVFSKRALSVCETLTENAQVFNKEGSRRRPQLDVPACIALLKFVRKQGLKCGWDISHTKDVLRGIHSKMELMRFKYGRMVRSSI